MIERLSDQEFQDIWKRIAALPAGELVMVVGKQFTPEQKATLDGLTGFACISTRENSGGDERAIMTCIAHAEDTEIGLQTVKETLRRIGGINIKAIREN